MTNLPNGRSETYEYNAIGQLLEVVENVDGSESVLYAYSYDSAGNVIQSFKRNSFVEAAPEISTSTCNSLNQLTGRSVMDSSGSVIETFTYSYDGRGNLVSETSSKNGEKTYLYDASNRMVLGATPDLDTSSYVYNALGFLVEHNGMEYVVDYTSEYQSVLAKIEGSGTKELNIYGLDKISVIKGSLKTYIQSDRLGSGRIASDEQGDVVGTVQLDEWGNVVAKNDPRGVLNSYTNHELDDVIGAYFAKARYYDPSIKRFLAFDPKLGAIGNPKSLNRYTYVFNSPIKFIDPNGEDASLPDYKDAVLGELSGILDIVIPSILAKLVTVEIILLLPNLISLEKIIVNIIADVGFVIMIEAGRITELQ